MNKGGTGIGSASVIVVFVILCLTVFSFLSFEMACVDKAATDKWRRSVNAYYAADGAAEKILAKILEEDEIPPFVRGVPIKVSTEKGSKTVRFSCPVSEQKELSVEVLISESRCQILEWRTRDLLVWEADEHMQLWPGISPGT